MKSVVGKRPQAWVRKTSSTSTLDTTSPPMSTILSSCARFETMKQIPSSSRYPAS
jgi:hypothetical protein